MGAPKRSSCIPCWHGQPTACPPSRPSARPPAHSLPMPCLAPEQGGVAYVEVLCNHYETEDDLAYGALRRAWGRRLPATHCTAHAVGFACRVRLLLGRRPCHPPSRCHSDPGRALPRPARRPLWRADGLFQLGWQPGERRALCGHVPRPVRSRCGSWQAGQACCAAARRRRAPLPPHAACPCSQAVKPGAVTWDPTCYLHEIGAPGSGPTAGRGGGGARAPPSA